MSSTFTSGPELGLNTTFPGVHRLGIQFALFPFRSPLLRESLLISFPAGTRMFWFPAFLYPKGYDMSY